MQIGSRDLLRSTKFQKFEDARKVGSKTFIQGYVLSSHFLYTKENKHNQVLQAMVHSIEFKVYDHTNCTE